MGQYEYDQAVKAFEEAVAAAPGLLDAQVNLAIALFNRGRKEDADIDRAGKLLDEALASDPMHLRAIFFKGIMLQHAGNAEEAIGCFEKVTRELPQDGAAWYLLGLCQQRAGRPSQEALLRAVELRPGLYSAYYQLYQTALRAGDVEKAKEYMALFSALRQSPLGESIELPQYNQMGDLALARPLASEPRPITRSRFEITPAKTLFEQTDQLLWRAGHKSPTHTAQSFWELGGLAVADFDQDKHVDLIATASRSDSPGHLILLKADPLGSFDDATAGSGLEQVRHALSCAVGDFDNDTEPDLFVACAGENFLFKGNGNCTFTDVGKTSGTGADGAVSWSGLFLDADHDGDLDILVCNAGAVPDRGSWGSQLLNNNGDGTFTDIASGTDLACADTRCVMALFGDVDSDRDADIVILRAGAPARLFFNDLGGRFRLSQELPEIRADLGGAMQDFDRDGHLDILALGVDAPQLRLFVGDGRARFRNHQSFENASRNAQTWGHIRGLRVADVDIDGDLDIGLFGQDCHALLNAGSGKFVWRAGFWPENEGLLVGAELIDMTGDLVPDLVTIERAKADRISLLTTELSPPSTALAVAPTGMRERDGRTRSPASGYGVKSVVRTGMYEQTLFHSGQAGGPNQSCLPLVFGLGGAAKADYVMINWPDGVAQVEIGLAAGGLHTLAELQRKISSCPVLFAWNGRRFEFITDFAGVGGLGYYVGPGESARPQVLDYVKIESKQLRPKDDVYELRITEPMEEAAYVDRLELLAIDHPRDHYVFPDERLAVGGPPPTHRLIVIDERLFPVMALDSESRDCTERLTEADRVYAYAPPLDRRYFGFCRRHSLELDFGDRLSGVGPGEPVYLFVRGYIEYPYSQTTYAAAQSALKWEPIRVDRREPDGRWVTVVTDAGAPGGTDRTMTIDVTGHVSGPRCVLRLTTNLEIGYDQVFVAKDAGLARVNVRAVPLLGAELRRAGFAREFSPDGRQPLIYDYELSDASAPFHTLRGAYTRYGDVTRLIAEFDDELALIGPGDEIAIRFDTSTLPSQSNDIIRDFVLVSHAYCKDMDLYTATPQTLEPLPFRGMSKYPYPANEHFPDTPQMRVYHAEYNTRIVE